MSNKFTITWEASDGYCGGGRPHSINFRADELEDDMSDADLESLFWDAVRIDFENQVSPVSNDQDNFIAWAKEQIARRGNK